MTDAALGPVQPQERIQLVDVLRGFALLGILQVNFGDTSEWLWKLIEFFAEGSFYTTYSFLFGLGFALQMIRAEEVRRPFLLRYLWRTAILYAFGTVHGIFIWGGDILRDYALVSPLLLLVRRVRPALILAFAGAVLVFTIAPEIPSGQVLRRVNPERVEASRLAMWVTNMNFLAYPPAWCQAHSRPERCVSQPGLSGRGVSAPPGPRAIHRCQLVARLGKLHPVHVPGRIYIGRRRLHRDAARHTRLLLWIAGISLPLGLAGNGLSVYGEFFTAKGIALPDAVARWVSDYYLGNIGLALFYLSGLTVLFTHWRRAALALAPLANVGRMGLTNYLMQSVIFSLILGSFGLDVMSHVKEGYSLLAINSFFVVQILYSSWWFKYFRFGPAEWVWRSLTWWRLQPMRVQARPASGEAR